MKGNRHLKTYPCCWMPFKRHGSRGLRLLRERGDCAWVSSCPLPSSHVANTYSAERLAILGTMNISFQQTFNGRTTSRAASYRKNHGTTTALCARLSQGCWPHDVDISTLVVTRRSTNSIVLLWLVLVFKNALYKIDTCAMLTSTCTI